MFFDFLKKPDFHEKLAQFHKTKGAVLIDVRTQEEFQSGHIPHSRHIGLGDISRLPSLVADRQTPLFLYCLSGGRSAAAAAKLKRMGYQNITNLGGIADYRGTIVST